MIFWPEQWMPGEISENPDLWHPRIFFIFFEGLYDISQAQSTMGAVSGLAEPEWIKIMYKDKVKAKKKGF